MKREGGQVLEGMLSHCTVGLGPEAFLSDSNRHNHWNHWSSFEGEGESSGSGWARTPIVQRAQRSRIRSSDFLVWSGLAIAQPSSTLSEVVFLGGRPRTGTS